MGACAAETPKVKLVRNLRTSEKSGNTWLFLECSILEAGGFEIGCGVKMTIDHGAVIFTKSDDKTHIVSKRNRAGWKRPRPLMDRCSREITAVLRAREQIDILVSDGMLVIRQTRSFDLAYIRTPMLMGNNLKQIRTLSVPGGAGLGAAALVDTGMYSSVGSLDIWAEAIDSYLHNFRNSVGLFTDLRTVHPEYIPAADLVFLTPECVEFSLLGGRREGVFEALSPHYARICFASGSDYVLMEQVTPYYKSRAFEQLKSLLSIKYRYMAEPVTLDAYDYGSVAGRRRGYCLFSTKPLDAFQWPAAPRIPDHRRPKLREVLKGFDLEAGDFRPIAGTVMEGLLNKSGPNNNFKAESNHTLVTPESTRIGALVTHYRKVQVTSSYLRHPKDSQQWRMFTPKEIMKLLSVPDWYQFDEEIISDATQTKLLAQSVDGNVVRSIGAEIATFIMGSQLRDKFRESVLVEENGQLALF
jgi:DNA (cytosine-5)-methyltransferase 1